MWYLIIDMEDAMKTLPIILSAVFVAGLAATASSDVHAKGGGDSNSRSEELAKEFAKNRQKNGAAQKNGATAPSFFDRLFGFSGTGSTTAPTSTSIPNPGVKVRTLPSGS